VTMTTRMPAHWHSLTASGTSGRSGSASPITPRNSNGNADGVSGQGGPVVNDLATANTRIPCSAISLTLLRIVLSALPSSLHNRATRFRSTPRGNYILCGYGRLARNRFPDVAYG